MAYVTLIARFWRVPNGKCTMAPSSNGRTQDSHSCNTGPIPVGATTLELALRLRVSAQQTRFDSNPVPPLQKSSETFLLNKMPGSIEDKNQRYTYAGVFAILLRTTSSVWKWGTAKREGMCAR